LRIVVAGAIASAVVIALGITMFTPIFIQPRSTPDVPRILLSFDVTDYRNLPEWCDQVSSLLREHGLKAVVFVTGRVAERYPECVSGFGDGVDIGSQTYDYLNLTAVSDYSVQLDEVKRGKAAVDLAGGISSRLFRAPYGATDENIYSLLSRNDILADFSYETQYNQYYRDQFIRFDLTSYNGSALDAESLGLLSGKGTPVLIVFGNNTPIDQITAFVSALESKDIMFVNASELTGLNLTVRKVD
jgi:peptidoglycan/xylan/chitin deacetylase (PgdA/CDA1 family)